jgi:hypothetical protein
MITKTKESSTGGQKDRDVNAKAAVEKGKVAKEAIFCTFETERPATFLPLRGLHFGGSVIGTSNRFVVGVVVVVVVGVVLVVVALWSW